MAIKEFLRRLCYEVNKRDDIQKFSLTEFYFPEHEETQEELEREEMLLSELDKKLMIDN